MTYHKPALAGLSAGRNGVCLVLLLLSGVVYGSAFSWMKLAVEDGANPLGAVSWFVLVASLILTPVQVRTGSLRNLPPGTLRFCLAWATLSLILPNLFFFYASEKLQAGLLAIAIALVPLFTFAGALALRRERLNIRRAFGLVLGALGVALILLPESSLPNSADLPFVLLALAGSACYALEHLYIEAKLPKGASLTTLLFILFSTSVAVLMPLAVLTGNFIQPNWPWQQTEWALVGLSAVTVLDYFIITHLIRIAGPVYASQAAYVVTLAGVAWGLVVFGESHSAWIWTALALLIVGVICVQPRNAANDGK